MKSFEERKKEYLDILINRSDLMHNILNDVEKKTDAKIKLEMLMDPKNDRELEYAQYNLDYILDTEQLFSKIFNSEFEIIPIEDNVGFKFLIDVINLTKTQDTLNEFEEYLNNIIPEKLAKIVYDFNIGILYNDDVLSKYFAKQTGLDLYNPVEVAILNIHINDAKASITTRNVEIENDNSFNYFKQFINEYHKLCVGEIKKVLK